MKILLIQPRMNKRPMDTDLKTRMSPSLGLLTLIALTPEGHEVIMVNENAECIDYDCGAQLVGITVTLDVMPRAARIAAAFRERGAMVVAGGVHVSCCPDECRAHFDAICVGPAERVWAHMIGDAQAGSLRAVYRDVEGFSGGEIASPAYGAIDPGRYLFTNVLTTSRGCPNRCAFCYNSCENRVYARRPIGDVVRDIEALGTRQVFFIDDNLIGDPEHTRALLAAIRGMGLVWGAAVTTRILEYPDILDSMAETGCQSLFIGFESINEASLKGVNKDNAVRRYEALVEAIHGRGIMINASMVFGLDGDDAGTFERTLAWLQDMRIETLTSHILTPYPGTALYANMEAAGRITDRRLEHYNTAHVVFSPTGMTAGELERGYRRMYKRFYSIRSIMRRMPLNRAQRKPYLIFNLGYRRLGGLISALARLIPMRALGRMGAWVSYRAR